MGAMHHLKAWWITDDPDDVARERYDRDMALETLERITAEVVRLNGEIAEVTRQCTELELLAAHYRSGWHAGSTFADYRAEGDKTRTESDCRERADGIEGPMRTCVDSIEAQRHGGPPAARRAPVPVVPSSPNL